MVRGWRCSSVIECLSNIYKVLDLRLSSTNTTNNAQCKGKWVEFWRRANLKINLMYREI